MHEITRLRSLKKMVAESLLSGGVLVWNEAPSDPSPVPPRLMKTPAAGHPLPSEREVAQGKVRRYSHPEIIAFSLGEKVADVGGRMRGYFHAQGVGPQTLPLRLGQHPTFGEVQNPWGVTLVAKFSQRVVHFGQIPSRRATQPCY